MTLLHCYSSIFISTVFPSVLDFDMLYLSREPLYLHKVCVRLRTLKLHLWDYTVVVNRFCYLETFVYFLRLVFCVPGAQFYHPMS